MDKTQEDLIREIKEMLSEQPPVSDLVFHITKSEMISVCEMYEVDPTPYLEKFFND